jgi:cytochrome c-type biogenesis protein CcmH/NrfF
MMVMKTLRFTFSLLLPVLLIITTSYVICDSLSVAESVYSEINSPFCKGKLLRDCPSNGASALKAEIRDMASEGQNKDQIILSLYSKYGDEIRAIPTDSIGGKIAWIIPFIFIFTIMIATGLWLRLNVKKS